MKNWKETLVIVVLAVAVSTLGGHGEEPKKKAEEPKKGPDPKKVQALMKQKLEAAQKVLEGIAQNDFDTIGKNSEELMRISKQAEWMVHKTPMYEVFSNDFRRSAEALIQNAKDKNLDGAALTYVDLTMTCVKCHKHVREIRSTQKEPKSDGSRYAFRD